MTLHTKPRRLPAWLQPSAHLAETPAWKLGHAAGSAAERAVWLAWLDREIAKRKEPVAAIDAAEVRAEAGVLMELRKEMTRERP